MDFSHALFSCFDIQDVSSDIRRWTFLYTVNSVASRASILVFSCLAPDKFTRRYSLSTQFIYQRDQFLDAVAEIRKFVMITLHETKIIFARNTLGGARPSPIVAPYVVYWVKPCGLWSTQRNTILDTSGHSSSSAILHLLSESKKQKEKSTRHIVYYKMKWDQITTTH